MRTAPMLIAVLLLAAPAAGEPPGPVYVVPVEGEISRGLVYLVRRGIREAEAARAAALVLRMNTNGGRLDATEEIMEELAHTPLLTITFVDHKAFSAGAFIAIATKAIYMAPGGLIGAATPVMVGPGGGRDMGEAIEEKVTSATRAMIRSAARRNGHPAAVVEAMVDRDVEIPDVSPKGKLLTLTAEEAAEEAVGLSLGTVSSVEEILRLRGLEGAAVVAIEPRWSEKAALFLTHSVVSGLLLMAGMMGLYIEFKTPGFGLPGLAGLAALGLFFWGHRVAGLAGFEELAILLLGLLLLGLEIFVIPGFGVAGIAGIAAIFAAILSSMLRRFPGAPVVPELGRLAQPLLSLGIGIAGSFFGAAIALRYLPRAGAARGIILTEEERAAEGFRSAPRDLAGYVGREGVALTDLRPAGKARFGEELLDVVTEGDYLDRGSRITVLAVEGGRVVVAARRA
ncbi:MAG: NfeD family protein [bacterium]|nr:NfeD family protein [bacterium]